MYLNIVSRVSKINKSSIRVRVGIILYISSYLFFTRIISGNRSFAVFTHILYSVIKNSLSQCKLSLTKLSSISNLDKDFLFILYIWLIDFHDTLNTNCFYIAISFSSYLQISSLSLLLKNNFQSNSSTLIGLVPSKLK